jgi:putative sterol carrier protein
MRGPLAGCVVSQPVALRYLSLDWIDTVSEAAEASPELREAAAGRNFGVTEVVTDGPEGDVTYHLSVVEGVVGFGPGPADEEDVRFVQDWDTAVAVAQGRLNAQEAFLQGRIRLTGDQAALLANQPVFAALDAVFRAVREQTEHA